MWSRCGAFSVPLVCVWMAAITGCEQPVQKDPERTDPLDALSPAGDSPLVVRIGVTPTTGSTTARRFEPLVRYLLVEHEMTVELVVAETYDALEEMVDDQSVHAGVFSPLAYVRARRSMDAVAIATATRAGSPTYLGYLVARAEPGPAAPGASDIPELDDYEGKRIAWGSPSSTSGYLYPRAMLRGRGYDPERFFAEQVFAGDHQAALDRVMAGSSDVAAVAAPFVDEGPAASEPHRFVVLAKTDRIPLDCVVVHERIARALAERLRAGLLALDQNQEASLELAQSWGVGGFVTAHDGRYDVIEEVLAAEEKVSADATSP